MYTTLDEIIKSLFIQLELAGEHAYLRFFELARLGLKELSFDTTKHVKTSLLAINKNTNSANLPLDYIKYTRIGAYNEDGTINYLAKADNLYIGSASPSKSTEVDALDTDPPLWTDGAGIGKQYGKGGGQNAHGYYRLNDKEGTIEFASSINVDEIVLEYITDGIDNLDSTSNVQIHSFASDALRAYIYWAHIKYKRDYSATDKEIAKKDFYNQKRTARARIQSMTKDEILVQSRKHIRQSPKY